ncbi:MAG: peptide chain release factor N(5)-glutamine methyltransferase [Rhodocyclales bacterium]|nr:peptide chain release factor N(5)-glutamine methyltransferase [Rhodocyclales bacterium]
MTTVAAALAAARAKLPANEARLLLGQVLQQAPAWLLAHDDESLDEDALLTFASFVARRAGGEPVAYLLGYREFFGRRFGVGPSVLIPRPETELLVELAIARVGADGTANILDLGTGSGCIAITLALELPLARLTAVDSSAEALRLASANSLSLGTAVRLAQSDWFSGLTGEKFELIVSNPPYVASGDSHLRSGDLRHEPSQALASGADGLDAIRQIVATAPRHLSAGGALLIEHAYDQAVAVGELLRAASFSEIRTYPDLAGILRVTGAVFAPKDEMPTNSR